MAGIKRLNSGNTLYPNRTVQALAEKVAQNIQEAAQAGVLWGGQKNPPYITPPGASINESTGSYSVKNDAYSAYMAELERQRAERQRMLDEQYNQGKQNIRDTARTSNKQAYIAYMQGLKNMPQAAAMYGSGGMAQSLANKSQLNYENNRKDIEKAKISALGELESDYRSGVMSGQDRYLTALKNAPDRVKTYSVPQYTTTLGDKTLYKGGNKEQSIDALTSQLLSMGYTRAQITDYLKRQGLWGEK